MDEHVLKISLDGDHHVVTQRLGPSFSGQFVIEIENGEIIGVGWPLVPLRKQ